MDGDKGVLTLTARIVSAHARKNQVAVGNLPALIRDVHRALATVEQAAEVAPVAPMPAVPVKKSVFPDHIVCLEDGKKLTMLTRYLRGRFGMTPDKYRARWGLPADYPMVAPNYAKQRSESAKARGLGRTPTAGADAAEPAQAGEPKVTVLPARRARGAKA